MHVTFGVETALAGTYESLLHHALEVAAVQHPFLFELRRPQVRGGRKTKTNEGRVRCAALRCHRGCLPCLTLILTLTLTLTAGVCDERCSPMPVGPPGGARYAYSRMRPRVARPLF